MNEAARHEPAPALHEHAAENLRYIRSTMEKAGTFTAIPGRGMIVVGFSAFIAAGLSGADPAGSRWFIVWGIELLLAAAIGMFALVRKARATATPLTATPARRFALAFVPALAAGGILTAALLSSGARLAIPPVWLLLYGVGVTAGGALSVRAVPVMGAIFFAVGVVAFFSPASAQQWLMAAGFGGLHVIFGAVIVRSYGG